MLCPMCNEMNKVDARYCEYCGTKLETVAVGVAATATSVSQSQPVVVSALTCPQCGAVVLLDESFCDNCGHVLKQNTGQSGIIPTNVSAAIPVTPPSPTSVSGEIRMPDLPSGGFVGTTENMNDYHQGTSNASAGIEYHITDDVAPEVPFNNAPVVADVVVADAPEMVSSGDNGAETADSDDALHDADNQPVQVADEPTYADVDTSAQVFESSSVSVDEDTGGANQVADVVLPAPSVMPVVTGVADAQSIKQKRQSLEEEIKRQKDIIQQLNQMRNAFREVTPQAVLMGIEEAEQKLRDTQAELDALPTPPEVDPQVIERLRKDHMRQLEIIDQFEQLQRTFGLATPRAVIQGIVEARETEERLRHELQALGVQMAPQSTSAPDIAPEIPVPPPVPVIVEPEPMPSVIARVAPPASMSMATATPAAQLPAVPEVLPTIGQVTNPAPPPARLQLESGTSLQLPAGRREIIIGRSDPISAVHPEIDLTPYGAESGGVSRRHVRLTVIDGQWMITDLQSTNHTRVNGVRIDPGVPTQLPDGAQVVLGRVGFIFRSA